MTKFNAGDSVSWLGMKCMVTNVDAKIIAGHPIEVRCRTESVGQVFLYFTPDGRLYKEQRPSLKLLKKRKYRYEEVASAKIAHAGAYPFINVVWIVPFPKGFPSEDFKVYRRVPVEGKEK